MAEDGREILDRVVRQIPSGLFVLTTAYEDRRSGVLARWVQRCSVEPPMVMVAIPKGQPVEPLILDSRHFALCRIESDDRLLVRKFTEPVDRGDDPFIAISTVSAPSGSPILDRAASYLDCEVVRHIELESDHRVYVGLVNAAGSIVSAESVGLNGRPPMWVREG